MLYTYAGAPRNKLHAGGLQLAIEHVECLAELEHDPHVQYRKEGVFTVTPSGDEWRRETDYLLSPACREEGITWDWFPENWSFGNGVTVSKVWASPETKIVVYQTERTLEEYIAQHGPTKLADVELSSIRIESNGWAEYEARWTPGKCPQEPHIVHLTHVVTEKPLTSMPALLRMQALVEASTGRLIRPEFYEQDGHHFSTWRDYHGEKAHHKVTG